MLLQKRGNKSSIPLCIEKHKMNEKALENANTNNK